MNVTLKHINMDNDNYQYNLSEFIIQAFQDDQYDKVRNFFNTYKEKAKKALGEGFSEEKLQRALDKIICFDQYKVIKLTAQNSDIEGLLLLKEYLSPNSLYEAITHNNFEALESFINDGKAVSVLGFFDKEVFEEGLDFFYNSLSNGVNNNNELVTMIHNNLTNYKEINDDINSGLASLEEKLLGNIEDS